MKKGEGVKEIKKKEKEKKRKMETKGLMVEAINLGELMKKVRR